MYDIATRLMLYTEDLKANQGVEFDRVLYETEKTLKNVLYNVDFETLDSLSKTKLNNLISELRKAQFKIYSVYLKEFTKKLEEYVDTNSEVNMLVWASYATALNKNQNSDNISIVSEKEASAYIKNNPNKRALTIVMNTPLPANGLYPATFLRNFTVFAKSSIENVIRKAWANKWTIEQTLVELLGKKNGQLRKLKNQSNAVTHSILSHSSCIVSAAVLSCFFEKYIWNSVIDSRTTDICRSRNKKVYTFGKGPLPPAHINCRSGIAPYVPGSAVPKIGFYSWLLSQDEEFQDDLLGSKTGELLRSGKLISDDFARYQTRKPLTFEQFRSKIKRILTVSSVN